MSQPRVTMYITGWCPYCQRAGALMSGKGLTFEEINVDEDVKLRNVETYRHSLAELRTQLDES